MSQVRLLRQVARFAAVLTIFCAPAAPCFAQTAASYIFASGDTGTLATLQEARANLQSFEQLNITAVADRISCTLTPSVRIADAVGVYSDSAENSYIVQSNLGTAQAEYAGSLLGRYAHQKFILLFTPKPIGPDRLWILRSTQPWEVAIEKARNLQLTPLTMVTEKEKTAIYVVDFGAKQTAALTSLKTQLNAEAETLDGTHEMLGDDDRGKAMALYQRTIDSAERRGAKHLSASLWTQDWHDATTRTCSKR